MKSRSYEVVRALHRAYRKMKLGRGDGELLHHYGFAVWDHGWRLTPAGVAEYQRIFTPAVREYVEEHHVARQLADKVSEVARLHDLVRELEKLLVAHQRELFVRRDRIQELEKSCKQLEATLAQAYKYAPPARDETVFRLSERNAELSQKVAALEKEIVPLRRARARYKYLRQRIEKVFALHDRRDAQQAAPGNDEEGWAYEVSLWGNEDLNGAEDGGE